MPASRNIVAFLMNLSRTLPLVCELVEDMDWRNSVLVVRSSLLAKWLWERIRFGLGLFLCDQIYGNKINTLFQKLQKITHESLFKVALYYGSVAVFFFFFFFLPRLTTVPSEN